MLNGVFGPTQGTVSSKKKKVAKLKRVMATVKRASKKDKAGHVESFAAVQLLHDPQVQPYSMFAFSSFTSEPSRGAVV